MARSVICLLALMLAGGLARPDPEPVPSQREHPHPVVVSHEDLEFQKKLLLIFYQPHQPLIPELNTVAQTWGLVKNIDQYNNATAVHISQQLIEGGWVLPFNVPFSVLEQQHRWQAATFFNLLYSAKTKDVFYKTLVYLRAHINEYMLVYVASVAIAHRPDTQGFIVPPLYEIFPSFFNNAEIMTTAQRISVHGKNYMEHYPSTYIWDNDVVIRRNATVWPYYTKYLPLSYFTHDFALNNFYYNMHILYPSWLGGETVPLVKDRRGEWYWFMHKQLVARYYMERLCNGLGEIPELDMHLVEEGYASGLIHQAGISYPVRPNYFLLEQPNFINEIIQIADYEHRIRDAIDLGYITTPNGEHVDIHSPDAIDVLGRLVQAGVDSPNNQYYKDFISIWKTLLGNSEVYSNVDLNGVKLVVPSALEQFQTTLRDEAFYMVWKRVLQMFASWHKKLPPYTKEELGLPGVVINKVEVDKLVTYFEHTYMNVTNYLPVNNNEEVPQSVLVEHNRLNHKVFGVRIHLSCQAPQNVVARLYLAPKYDSKGQEIPLEVNSQNFLQVDQLIYNCKQGQNVISYSSNDNQYVANDPTSIYNTYNKLVKALDGNEQYMYNIEHIDRYPQRLLLPKGRVGGMPFVVMVHIAPYHAPNVLYGTGYNPSLSLGIGSGARRITSDPLGFPVDRPLYPWQVEGLQNIYFEDVLIHHKHTPEVIVSHVE
ncbi:unnamed protein product [Chilo suppressalis]|uniref:Uncharacterized protein n=1 Tax=Chilo suppressalis TaxID=168631 RepID=A0ABN8L341_CHISP|nr:unnamed protein product [Chilo suppressalis]